VKRVLSFVVALGAAALFSSAALAGADCSYHKTQAAVDSNKTETKEVVAAPTPDKDTPQVQTAQAGQQDKNASAQKK
jgi:hypothetical protein